MAELHEYAVAVFIETPEGIPLVRDPKKPTPVFWKLPGGRSEVNETPEKAAVREVKEETGITLETNQLVLVTQEARSNHEFFLFKASIPSLAGLKTSGNEGEEVKAFSQAGIKTIELFPPHKKLLENLVKVK